MKKSEFIEARISKEDKILLENYCNANERTLSRAANKAIKRFIKEEICDNVKGNMPPAD